MADPLGDPDAPTIPALPVAVAGSARHRARKEHGPGLDLDLQLTIETLAALRRLCRILSWTPIVVPAVLAAIGTVLLLLYS